MDWIRPLLISAVLTAPQLCVAAVLDRFVGQYPFERVNGRTVYQVVTVRDSMERLLGRKRANLVRSFGGAIPIEELQDAKLRRLIYVWQCQQHNCPNQVGVFLHPDGEAIAACISDLDGDGRPRTEWIGQGWRTTNDVDCGSGDEALKRFNAARARAEGRQ